MEKHFSYLEERDIIRNHNGSSRGCRSSKYPYSHLNHFCIKKGINSVNVDVELFRVVVIKLICKKRSDKPDDDSSAVHEQVPPKFAVLMSLSHIVGDGSTYYALYRMLSPNKKVETLIVERDRELVGRMVEINTSDNNFILSSGFLCNLITGLVATVASGAATTVKLFEINTELIEKEKRIFKENMNKEIQGDLYNKHAISDEQINHYGFVSTNDICSSLFFRSVSCDVGLMAVNFRGKVAGLSKAHAGNYESIIRYKKEGYESPGLIRHSLGANGYKAIEKVPQKFFRSLASHIYYNNFLMMAFYLHCAIITNWSGFYEHLEFKNCHHRLHMPIFEDLITPLPVAIIFKASINRIAIMVFEGKQKFISNLKSCCLVGQEILV